jgi:hypothetical protein
LEEDVAVDLGDARLAGVLNDPEFMLDSMDPKYKASKTTKKINEERRKRVKIRD